MVYIGNIINALNNLNEGEAIALLTKSNRRIIIERGDLLAREHGDLKVVKDTCYAFVDCAEVETLIVANDYLIRGDFDGD